ncbi:hypothetical protein HK104_003547 [Borealophlyctis nickersoniae]|nr:hypothetical protein HK104_003547 [Borealophlyctis nickersoniae]
MNPSTFFSLPFELQEHIFRKMEATTLSTIFLHIPHLASLARTGLDAHIRGLQLDIADWFDEALTLVCHPSRFTIPGHVYFFRAWDGGDQVFMTYSVTWFSSRGYRGTFRTIHDAPCPASRVMEIKWDCHRGEACRPVGTPYDWHTTALRVPGGGLGVARFEHQIEESCGDHTNISGVVFDLRWFAECCVAGGGWLVAEAAGESVFYRRKIKQLEEEEDRALN